VPPLLTGTFATHPTLKLQTPTRATKSQLTRFHSDEYIDFLEAVTPETADEMTGGGTRCTCALLLFVVFGALNMADGLVCYIVLCLKSSFWDMIVCVRRLVPFSVWVNDSTRLLRCRRDILTCTCGVRMPTYPTSIDSGCL
jgi:hypothetical protein